MSLQRTRSGDGSARFLAAWVLESALVLGSALILGSASGCGGAAPMAAEPPTDDLQELERRLDLHQSEVEARFGSLGSKNVEPPDAPEAPPADVGGGEAAEDGPTAEPAPPPAPASEAVQTDETESGDRDELSACEVGCQALEGMRRAAARICEVAGTTSDLCTRARTRVGRAEDRVIGAGCHCG